MLVETPKKYYTPEEYLELEEKSQFRNEYRNGEIIAMTGGTTNHNKIALNFARKFPGTIQAQDYEIYIIDVRLWIDEYHLYTYPDVMVIRGEPVYYGSGKSTITNPCLIVEVLSKSTRDYDRGDKFRYYRSISELQEYVLVDQYSFYVEQYVKQDEGQWLLKISEGEDAILSLFSLDFAISFNSLYHRVDFSLVEE